MDARASATTRPFAPPAPNLFSTTSTASKEGIKTTQRRPVRSRYPIFVSCRCSRRILEQFRARHSFIPWRILPPRWSHSFEDHAWIFQELDLVIFHLYSAISDFAITSFSGPAYSSLTCRRDAICFVERPRIPFIFFPLLRVQNVLPTRHGAGGEPASFLL